MLTENQAKWMFDKMLVLFRVPLEQVSQTAEQIRKLSRNDSMVAAMLSVVMEEVHHTLLSPILRDYNCLVSKYQEPKDSNEWWLEMYGAVNQFRQKYNYDPFVQELADAFCREMKRQTKEE